MRNRILAGVAITLVAVLGTSCGNDGGERTADRGQPARLGAKAPPFTLPSPDNGAVSLEDYRGRRPVLLYFSMGPG